MPTVKRAQVLDAMSPSPWDFGNLLLYDLCRDYPSHSDDPTILAKVLLIGRVYAAAIERRHTEGGSRTSDRFYIDKVAPTIRHSGIDSWLERARQAPPGNPDTLRIVIEVHSKTTELFGKISGLQKRSLASKYLHFHLPQHFYIFDSRAQMAIRAFSGLLPRASRWNGAADPEYRKFAEKCFHLIEHCAGRFGLRLLPRQLDNLLLYRGAK
jgi:hypothetical protein